MKKALKLIAAIEVKLAKLKALFPVDGEPVKKRKRKRKAKKA